MSDLDSFFAKKDKKKKGGKKGFSKANTDILAKNLEENDRKEAKADEKCAVPLATSEANKAAAAALQSTIDTTQGKDDEWKPYEEKSKDYSNLKVATLVIESDPEDDGEDEHEINEEGEKVRVKKDGGGPWNKLGKDPNAEESTEEKAPPKEENTTAAQIEANVPRGSVVGGSYVPPHMRGSQGSSGASSTTASRGMGPSRRNKQAPDINNQMYFPSLSAAAGNPDPSRYSKEDSDNFEEVRSGGGNQQHSRTSNAPKLTLDNKFAVLRD